MPSSCGSDAPAPPTAADGASPRRASAARLWSLVFGAAARESLPLRVASCASWLQVAMSSAFGTSARATPHPPNRTTAAMRDMNVSGMRNLHRSNLIYTFDGFAQDHAEPVRDAVFREHDVRRAGEEPFAAL